MTLRAAALALALLLALSGRASADPISLLEYQRVLADARAAIVAARASPAASRAEPLGRARELLAGAREVRVGGAVYTAAPHGVLLALIARGDDASLDLAVASLEATADAVGRAQSTGAADANLARASLDAILRSPDFVQPVSWWQAFLDWLSGVVASLFPGLRPPDVTREQITVVLGAIATLVLALVLSSALRGLRANVVREAVSARAVGARGPLPADHLRAAEEARRTGRLRDALRELFLATLLALEQRGMLRADPSLTDRELLARAAHLASRGDLEALVALYERAWYGLREPTDGDVERATDLARRIAA